MGEKKRTPWSKAHHDRTELVKTLDSAKEYFEALNEFFGRREAGLAPDNSEEVMFSRVHILLEKIDATLASYSHV